MYNLKIINSGDRVEIYRISNYIVNEGKKDIGNKVVDDLLKEDAGTGEEKREPQRKQSKKDRCRNLTDARNNIIRLIKSNSDMNTFITLTFAKAQNYKESKKSLNILFTKLRRDYIGLKYIWILEYGDMNKRLHYHLLCNIPILIKLSDSKHKKTDAHRKLESEFASRYWNYGFVYK